MLRIEDERVGAFMARRHRARRSAAENLSSRRDFGDVEVLLFDGESNPTLNAPILRLIREARESIVVQSAYLMFPFYEHLAEAAGRGVPVTRSGAEAQQQAQDDGLHRVGRVAGRRHGAALRRPDEPHQGDARRRPALVVGSSNFDYQSFHTNQEVVAIVRDPDVIAQYTREVLEPDLAQCVAPPRAGAGSGSCAGSGRCAEPGAWRCP